MVLQRTIGGALAGAAYVVIAGIDLHALPRSLFLAFLAAGAALGALPGLASGLYRRLRPATPPRSPAEAMLRGALATTMVVVFLAATCFLGIRKLGNMVGLVPDATSGQLLVHAGIATLLLAGVRAGGTALARRLPERAPPAGRAAALAGAALVLPVAAGVGGPRPAAHASAGGSAPEAPVPRLVIVGIDGLGMDVFERYRDAMPNLARFAERASRGTVHTDPPRLSGGIWTTIATGRTEAQHGVSNFELLLGDPDAGSIPVAKLYSDPLPGLLVLPAVVGWKLGRVSVLPATRIHRRGDAFWNDPAFGRVGIVCWPATWPVEPVAGSMVSTFWAPSKADMLAHHRAPATRLVHPPSLLERLAPSRRRSGDPPDEEMLALVPLTEEERGGFHPVVRVGDTIPPKEEVFSCPYYGWLNTLGCLDAGRAVLADRPGTYAVYFEGVDMVLHVLLPDERGIVPGFDEADSARIRPMMDGFLRMFDREIAWLLELGDERTTTIVLSDHSMAVDDSNAVFGNWHADGGLALVRGPGFGPDRPLGALRPEELRAFFHEIVSAE